MEFNSVISNDKELPALSVLIDDLSQKLKPSVAAHWEAHLRLKKSEQELEFRFF